MNITSSPLHSSTDLPLSRCSHLTVVAIADTDQDEEDLAHLHRLLIRGGISLLLEMYCLGAQLILDTASAMEVGYTPDKEGE